MKSWSRFVPVVSSCFAFLLVLSVGVAVEWALRAKTQWELRSKVEKDLSQLSSKLEHIFQLDLENLQYLSAHIKVYGDIDEKQFYRLAGHLVDEEDHIRYLGLAKKNKLTLVYPLAGNQKAIGQNLSSIPGLSETLNKAIENRSVVIDGPRKLTQGGRGVVGQNPIFIGGDDGRYWGVALIAWNFQKVMEDAGIPLNHKKYQFALQSQDSSGSVGSIFYGQQEVLDNQPQQASIYLPGRLWLLSAVPRKGWNEPIASYWHIRLIFLLFAVLVTVMTFNTARARYLFRNHALHDPLTGLPNRILFEDRYQQISSMHRRIAAGFCVALIDLDDFRVINVQSGHKHGDHILKDVAKRLVAAVRDTDTVARVGGDKFGVIVGNTDRKDSATQIANKMLETLSTTYHLPDDIHVVSGSIGLVMVNASSESFEDIMRRAEDALAIAKESGKARVHFK